MQYKVFFLLSFIDFRSWIPTFYCRLFQATHEDKLGISEWVQRTNERTITTEAAILISDIETQKKEHKEKATHHHYCRSSKKNQPLSPIKRKQSKSIASEIVLLYFNSSTCTLIKLTWTKKRTKRLINKNTWLEGA
jgi:hypothetical protein